ncbi:MAG: phosphatidate cytidylyltransferase [Lachnospiraceae bacterium]|nr:phosphatidate cytidylyltransferase [Lachnospiraceae bacterium]
MRTRIISAIVGLPILIVLVWVGGLPLKLGILAVSLVAMREFYCAFSKNQDKPIHLIGYAFAVFYLLDIERIVFVPNYFNIFVSLFMLIILIYIVIFHLRTSIYEALVTYFGFFYSCFLISHIYLIREYEYGIYFVWLAFICAWGCDTGAYFSGMLFGRHKLNPALSPKKTVEGAIGGVITSVTIGFIYGMSIEKAFPIEGVNSLLLCVVTSGAGAVLSQIGDLAASSIKRYTDIKDYGNAIPGHGGILDRFDSVLLTAPAVYYILLALLSID